MKSGIYQIRNTVDGKVYIGSAKDIAVRRGTHRHQLRRNKHHSAYLQNAWNKYGEDKFVFETLEVVNEESRLIEREQVWLDEIKPEYNISKVAGRVVHDEAFKQRLAERNRTRVWSEETKKKMSEDKKGVKRPDGWAAAHSAKMKGRKFTDEHKENMSKAAKGRIINEATRKAVAESNRKRIWTEESRKKQAKSSTGRVFSLESRLKRSESMKRTLQNKKK